MSSINESILTDGDMSQATLESSVIDTQVYKGITIQAVNVGSAAGELKLQLSIDNALPGQVVNWKDIEGSAKSFVGTGSVTWNVSDVHYKYIKVIYTKASGTGLLNIRYNIKEVK